MENTIAIVPRNDSVPQASSVGSPAESKAANAPTSAAPQPNPDIPPMGLAMRSIIVAIANTEKRERVAQYWRSKDYSVLAAANGLQVLDELMDALLGEVYVDATPMLLIVDDVLPGVLGRTIVDGVRDLGWTTPIVLIGGRARVGDDWTIALPEGCTDAVLHESAQALAKRSAANAITAEPAAEKTMPLATTLGLLGFRWSSHDDRFELCPPIESNNCLWSGTLTSWAANIHPKDRALVGRRFLRFANGQLKRLLVEVRWRAHFGRYRWVEIRGHKQPNQMIVGVVVDIDRVKRRQLRSAREAQRDGMTDLCNRKEFERRLGMRAKHTRDFGMLFLDLNGFKPINDALGHLAGDELLRQVGERLRQCVRQNDLVGRLGGDEFGVLITGPLGANRLIEVERRIHVAIGRPFTIAKHTFVMSTSIGSVDARTVSGSVVELWQAADVAMYRQKRGSHLVPLQA